MRHPQRRRTQALSIVIIQGTHGATHSPSSDVLRHLQQLAHAAGRTLELCPCGGLRDFVAQVRAAKRSHAEFMLLDPGELAPQLKAHPDAGLHEALDELDAPYVEVHDESDAELDRAAGSHHAPLATVIIQGDIGSSYRIGLGIALRQLAAAA